MMFASLRLVVVTVVGWCAFTAPSLAAAAKLDKETCSQLHTEQAKFIESGILADLARGADWGKANLTAERLRDVELYITLDEQIKFACREATLTPQMLQVEEIAKRLELNPNADPFAPPPPPEAKPDGDAVKPPKPAAQAKPKSKPKSNAAKAATPNDDAYKGPPIAGNEPATADVPAAAP